METVCHEQQSSVRKTAETNCYEVQHCFAENVVGNVKQTCETCENVDPIITGVWKSSSEAVIRGQNS